MSDFVLIYQGGSMPETEEAQKQAMAALGGVVHEPRRRREGPGQPVHAGLKTIAADGAVSDGDRRPHPATRSSRRTRSTTATTLAKGCPVLQGGSSISVHETFDVM